MTECDDFDLGQVVGPQGDPGKGITSIIKTGTSGLVDTYTITYSDGTTSTFTVTNGQDGSISGSIVTSWESTLSDSKVASEKLTKNTIDTKVPLISRYEYHVFNDQDDNSGYGFSLCNGYLVYNANEDKLYYDSTSETRDTSPANELATLGNIPTGSSTASDIKMNGTQSAGSSSNFAKADHIHPSDTSKQDTLVSGSNIKTVNNESLLGSGNISISGGADVVTSWESTLSDTKVPSEKLTKNSIDAKQDSLVSGTNIKTVNNESLLGSGNITISGGGATTGTFTDLQGLITSASSGDTIILDKDYKYDSTTDSSLTNGVEISKNLTIMGNGHVIDGSNTQRDFSIHGTSSTSITVNLNDIIIQNGYTSSNGGGIYAIYSNLTINNSTVQNNNTGNKGGAVYVSGSQLTITQSTLTNNKATDSYANIYSSTATTVYNCEIDNIATTCYNVTNKPYLTDHQSLSGYLTTFDIINDLTTGGTTKVLSAEQGKELNSLIGTAIAYINL